MGNLATTNDNAPPAEYTAAQMQQLRQHVANGCDDSELAYFLTIAQRSGLDPFARQIYAIKRGGRLTIQTGIDGYRTIAHRSGDFMGADLPVFGKDEGGAYCDVTVYKHVHGQRCAFPARAYDGEYNTGQNLWARMPRRMLEKCAEALALRKAFSVELSGVYTAAEMDQADTDVRVRAVTPDAPPNKYTPPDARDQLRRRWFGALARMVDQDMIPRLTDDERHMVQLRLLGVEHLGELDEAGVSWHLGELARTEARDLAFAINQALGL